MALQGQINQLSTEIKSTIVDGIETTGAICTDGTPAYGGTRSTEDFAGFEVYSLDIDDDQEEDEILDLPMIRFRADTTPVEYFLDDAAAYLSEFTFEVLVTEHNEKVIDGTLHTRKTLVNWYLERLEYVLNQVELTVVTEFEQRNLFSINHGRVALEDEFIYFGTTKLTVKYLRDVS